MRVGFLITAYDQKREVNFTVNMLRKMWKRTVDSPVVVVISGDPERSVRFPDDKRTRTVTLDDMVGSRFNELVSTSIMKQIMHGMIEMRDLERETGLVDIIVHMHGDILLLNENGFFDELEKFAQSSKMLACDTVGPQSTDYISFDGLEIMPQLFAVKRELVSRTGFMNFMDIRGLNESRSTEWALRRNLHRAALKWWAFGNDEQALHNELVYTVSKHRSSQWNLHRHWGGFTHFGNSIHFSKEAREAANEAALRAYGVDLTLW